MSLERIQLLHLGPGFVHQLTEPLCDIGGDIFNGMYAPGPAAPCIHGCEMTWLWSLRLRPRH